jgi:hypothetical protein
MQELPDYREARIFVSAQAVIALDPPLSRSLKVQQTEYRMEMYLKLSFVQCP